MFAGMWEFISTLMAGGTTEIVLLIVLIVVALILFLLALWVLWKLIGIAARGLVWLFGFLGGKLQSRTAARKEAQRSRPPPVATGWGRSGRFGLRVALADARRLVAPDALCVVVVAGEGGAGDLCRSLGLTPPPAAAIGIAAGGKTLLIDATRATRRELRRLARAMPYQRPVDGVAVLANADGLPVDGIARATDFARAAGMRVALHMVLPSRSAVPAWRIINAENSDGAAICGQLAADTVRIWLKGGERQGLQELALAQSRELPGAIDRAISVAPSALVDVASLGFSGSGLRGALAQAVGRTRPVATAGVYTGVAYASLVIGMALTVLVTLVTLDRLDTLRGSVSIIEREASQPWTIEGIEAVPSGPRVGRLAGISTSLADMSGVSMLTPLGMIVPNRRAPLRLGAAVLDGYLLRPLGTALDRQARERIAPTPNLEVWLENAGVIGAWAAAWDALGDDPREVDIQGLMVAAFGGVREDWPADLDLAIIETDVDLPLPAEGGFDVDGISDMARENFILASRMWAESVYTNGPVAAAANRTSDLSAGWRDQHQALLDLRAALQDPGQQWLTAAEDQSDHASELRLLGRALALSLIGQTSSAASKAVMAQVRIAARNQVGQFSLPGVGALMTRASQGTGSTLQLSPEAAAWLRYLDRVANSGFGQPPARAGAPVRGTVTVDVDQVARSREKLQAYERISMDLLADLPAAPVRTLLAELASELVLGVVIEVENALRADNDFGVASARAERRAVAAAALDDLAEIEQWLINQQASSQAERVARVRARIADGVLSAAAEVLDEEDPLGIVVDPTADPDAILRRMERGMTRFRAIYGQYAQQFVEVSAETGEGLVVIEWNDIADDIAGYDRGDADSSLSILEGNVRAWVGDPDAACAAPRSPTGRGDYLARAVADFRASVETTCLRLQARELEQQRADLLEHYETYLARSWPFVENGAEADPAALAEFLLQLQSGIETHEDFLEGLPPHFGDHAALWASATDSATILMRFEWKWQPDIELLSEHVMEANVLGAELDEMGVYSWRYGEPFALHFRLARNSPYRFRLPDGRIMLERTVDMSGRGALLRILETAEQGEWVFTSEMQNLVTGQIELLRFTARVTHDDGRPLIVPST